LLRCEIGIYIILLPVEDVPHSNTINTSTQFNNTSQYFNHHFKFPFKMQFSNILSIAAIFALAAATPVAEPAASPKAASPSPLALFQRQASNAGVELCTDAGFTGRCVHIVQPIGQCSAYLQLVPDLQNQC
jgi:hypothetical protein